MKKGRCDLPNTFSDGFSVMMRLTYATSLLIHSMSSYADAPGKRSIIDGEKEGETNEIR